MIRRLFTLSVFTVTVILAAFGQSVFGREDIVKIAHQAKAEAPQHAQHIWHETDKFLATLEPEAGSNTNSCTFEYLDWPQRLS